MAVSARGRRDHEGDTLAVHMELQPDRVQLRLAGAFDVSSRPVLEGYVASICNAGRQLVVIDVAELGHCDSAALAGFVRAMEICRCNGRLVAVVGASAEVRHALEDADMRDVLIEVDGLGA